ncbi:MAG: hypothetical protein ACREOI_13805 [bacterium]
MSTNIALTFQTNYDLALLSAGLKVRLVRLLVNVCFKTTSGWTAPYEAIVDTGNPITVIPQKIRQQISSQILYPNKVDLLEIGQGSVRGQLASVVISFQDPQTTSPLLQAKAYLLDDDSAPLSIGFEDGLTELRLVSDYPQQQAYFEIP